MMIKKIFSLIALFTSIFLINVQTFAIDTIRIPLSDDYWTLSLVPTFSDFFLVSYTVDVPNNATEIYFNIDAENVGYGNNYWDSQLTVWTTQGITPYIRFYDANDNEIDALPTYTVVGTIVTGDHIISLTSRYAYDSTDTHISEVFKIKIEYFALRGYTIGNPGPNVYPPITSDWYTRLALATTFEYAAYDGSVPPSRWQYYGGATGYIEKRIILTSDIKSVSFFFPRDYLANGFILETQTSKSRAIFYDASNVEIETINMVDITSFINGYWVDFLVPDGARQVVIQVLVDTPISASMLEDLETAIEYEINRNLFTIYFYDGSTLIYSFITSNRLDLYLDFPEPPVKPGFRFSKYVYSTYEPVDPNSPLKLDTLNSENELYIYLIYDNYDSLNEVEPNPNFLVELLATIGITNKFGYLFVLLFISILVIIICAVTGLNMILGGTVILTTGGLFYWLGLIGFIEVLIVIFVFLLTFLFGRARDE